MSQSQDEPAMTASPTATGSAATPIQTSPQTTESAVTNLVSVTQAALADGHIDEHEKKAILMSVIQVVTTVGVSLGAMLFGKLLLGL